MKNVVNPVVLGVCNAMLTMKNARSAKMDMAKPVEVPVLSVNLGVCYAKRTIKNALRAKINLILLTREVNVESVPATVSHVTKTFLNVSNVKVDTERIHKLSHKKSLYLDFPKYK